jgi:hypothetical protein
MVIHETGEEAVHAHSAAVDTLTDRLEAAAPTATLLLDSMVLHAIPAWVTLKARDPIVIDPTRTADVGFGAAVYCTVPSPCPELVEVTVSHDAPLVAVQGQLGDVATAIEALVAPGPRLIESGARL